MELLERAKKELEMLGKEELKVAYRYIRNLNKHKKNKNLAFKNKHIKRISWVDALIKQREEERF